MDRFKKSKRENKIGMIYTLLHKRFGGKEGLLVEEGSD